MGEQQRAAQEVEGFVRIKILALEKNRRDIYVKFNAEVCCSFSQLVPGRH